MIEFLPCLECWADVQVVDGRLPPHGNCCDADAHASRVAVAKQLVKERESEFARAEMAVLRARRDELAANEALDEARRALAELEGGAR